MIAAGALALLLFVFGFVPLFGGPRYEAALLAGLVGPSWVACVTASAAHRGLSATWREAARDGVLRAVPFSRLLGESIQLAALHCGAVLLVSIVHGLIGTPCEPVPGFLLTLLGPILGMLLAGFVGVSVGILAATITRRRGLMTRVLLGGLGLFLPGLSAVLELRDFYTSPTVYAYDAFAGYFAGPLYDTVEYDLERLLLFRVGTLATMMAWLLIGGLLRVLLDGQGRVRIGSIASLAPCASRVARGMLGLAFGLGAVWHGAASEDLGLRGTTEGIRAALGREARQGSCVVHFSAGVEAYSAQLIAKECVGHLSQLGKYFEVSPPARVDVYLFASSAQKRRLMGAGRTYIAKPWRREIYIQPQGFPHPVLGHELAHVVSGEFGAGPLRVSGLLGGLVVDPGRVEGFAEAASPKEYSEGTLHQWTAAMKQLGLLPRLRSLFKLGFWGNSAARFYSASGSFVDFLREKYGAEVIKRWYQGGDVTRLTQSTWKELELGWHQHLDKQVVPAEVLEIARPRFSRPGVFQRRCPHAVDRALHGVRNACGVQEARAKRHAARAVALDATKVDIELFLPRCRWAGGDRAGAEKMAESLLSDEVRFSPAARRGGFDFLGNSRWLRGDIDGARAAYEAALALSFREPLKRQYDVKLWALAQERQAREAIRALLVPRMQDDQSPLVALAQWVSKDSKASVGAYLLARQAMSRGRVGEAVAYMERVNDEALPAETLKRESSRMRVLLACREVLRGADASRLTHAVSVYEKKALSEAALREARRLEARCLDGELKK